MGGELRSLIAARRRLAKVRMASSKMIWFLRWVVLTWRMMRSAARAASSMSRRASFGMECSPWLRDLVLREGSIEIPSPIPGVGRRRAVIR